MNNVEWECVAPMSLMRSRALDYYLDYISLTSKKARAKKSRTKEFRVMAGCVVRPFRVTALHINNYVPCKGQPVQYVVGPSPPAPHRDAVPVVPFTVASATSGLEQR
jgi:hypothetical protein